MLKHHLILIARTLRKNPGWTCIHIGGLTAGIACVFLIGLLVRFELSFDRFQPNADRIYRLVRDIIRKRDGQITHGAQASDSLAEKLPAKFPEIEDVVKIRAFGGESVVYREEDKQSLEKGLFHTSPNFFVFFSFPLLKGDPEKMLTERNTVVITQRIARKYFGQEDPIGKTLFIGKPLTVTGVAADPPPNMHLQFSMVTPTWPIPFDISEYVYFRLTKGTDPAVLESKFAGFIHDRPNRPYRIVLHLEPISDIHLFSHREGDISPHGDLREVYLLVGLALLILATACINYINLATARFATRAKEVGVRKAAGASRTTLVRQFLGEAIVLAIVAFICAIVVVELFLPTFRHLNGLSAEAVVLDWRVLGLCLMGIVLVVGCLAGCYPALFLSAFQPVDVLRGHLPASGFERHLRRGLVVFQIGTVCVLLICTAVVHKQVAFMKAYNPGFDTSQLMTFDAGGGIPASAKTIFLQNPAILKITRSMNVPGLSEWGDDYKPEGFGDTRIRLRSLRGDYDFLETYGLTLLQGRNFSRDFSTDERDAFILNEAAVKKLGWRNPIGKSLILMSAPQFRSDNARVIGVVKNFQFESLRNEIEPLVIGLNWKLGDIVDANTFSVRFRTDSARDVVNFIQKKMQELAPNKPFQFHFLNEVFEHFYRREERLMHILGAFALVAGLIPCLGLLGLAAFAVEQRTKEIGIRKILGASSWQIMRLIARSFLGWALAANAAAWPVAYWIAQRWLQNFAYHTAMGWTLFALVGLGTTLLVLLTVGTKTLFASQMNPVHALRRE